LLLIALVAVGTWIRRTQSGHQFWAVRLAPVRRFWWLTWRSRISYFLLLPTIILLIMFNYYPALSGLYHSFTVWKPGVETTWVGLQQFQAMLNSPYFWIGVKNAIILVLAAFAKLAVPLLVAELIFHIRSGPLQYLVRTFFVIPLVVPGIVSILLWINIYDPNIGLLSQTLQAVGLGHLAPPGGWLGDKNTALPSIIAMGFPWISPFALLIFYGGLISISQELFDAAKVDGVTTLSRFWRIDLPLLMSQVKLLLILAFIGSVQEFQSIFLTTGGGPGDVTYTPSLELYYQATRFNNFGLASAMGTVLFLVILVGTILNLRYVRSQTEYEAS
jgi:ABC-type sugar transport system permease subunit